MTAAYALLLKQRPTQQAIPNLALSPNSYFFGISTPQLRSTSHPFFMETSMSQLTRHLPRLRSLRIALVLAAFIPWLDACAVPPASAPASTDWPQFRGPNRDGVSRETNFLQKWPDNGPPLLWTYEGLGNGIATIATVGNRAYTIGTVSNKATCFCIDLDTRKQIWATPFGPGSGRGDQATPCVSGNRVFVMSVESTCAGLDADTGKLLWAKACRKDLHGDMQHIYGYSETPLADGDKCIFTPGAKDAAIMAVNRDTGEPIWKMPMPNFSEKGPPLASYSSLVISEACGVRQYVTLLGRGLVGVDAKTGKFLWGYDRIAIQHSNIPTPLVNGDYVWGSNAYGGGTACIKIVPDKDGPTGLKVEEQYYLKPEVCQNLCGQSVILGDYVYTGHGMYAGEPMCLEWKTGKIMWHAKQNGTGVAGLIAADGKLIFRAESGQVSLIEATPKGYNLISSFKPEGHKGGLSHPVVSNGKLYLRDTNTLLCYDLRAPAVTPK